MEDINWLRYVREVIDKQNDDEEDIYDFPDEISLKDGIRHIYQSIWGGYIYASSIFYRENQFGELEELEEFEEAKIDYSFNVDSLLWPNVYPYNADTIYLKLFYNWNDYLYGWLLTTLQIDRDSYNKESYYDISYRMFENIPEMSSKYLPRVKNALKFEGRIIDSSIVIEEKNKKNFREMRFLFLNVEVKNKISNILEFFLKADYYYQLDILYILKIYEEEENPRYSKRDNLFTDEFETLIDELDERKEINPKILTNIKKIVGEENCPNSWYWELVKDIWVDDEVLEERPSHEPCWEMKLCLLCLKDSRKIFIFKDKQRYDGFRYTDLKNLWKQIKEIGKITNAELEEYYFEALTGKELCLVESFYYGRIPKPVRDNKEIEKMFCDIFDQFHTFPNICSRTIFVKEIMEMFCVFGSDLELIRNALEILCNQLPNISQAIAESMKIVVNCIINSDKYELEDLRCGINAEEMSKVWKKQLGFILPQENEIDEEIYKKFSRSYIQKRKIMN